MSMFWMRVRMQIAPVFGKSCAHALSFGPRVAKPSTALNYSFNTVLVQLLPCPSVQRSR